MFNIREFQDLSLHDKLELLLERMEMSSGFKDVTLKLNRTKSNMSFKNESILGSVHNNNNNHYLNPTSTSSIMGTPQSPYIPSLNPSMIKSCSTPNSFLGLGTDNIYNNNRGMSVLKENINKNNGSH